MADEVTATPGTGKGGRAAKGPAKDNQARWRGSRTAELVAASRARHLVRHAPPWVVEDRYAIHFAGNWRTVIRNGLLDWLFSRIILRRLMPVTLQQLTRARFAEDRILAAVERGVSQLVILGSGFDTFALRHPDLPLTVFEVDLAATEKLKQERMAAAGIRSPAGLRFVMMDFERDDLGERLSACGFDRGRPGFFNWMGVTYYLAGEALRNSVAALTDLAAPGSELTLDYLIAEESAPEENRALYAAVMRFVARRGEPFVSAFDPEQAPREMGFGDDWELVPHDSPADQAERYLSGRTDLPPLAPLFGCLHLRRK